MISRVPEPVHQPVLTRNRSMDTWISRVIPLPGIQREVPVCLTAWAAAASWKIWNLSIPEWHPDDLVCPGLFMITTELFAISLLM